MISAGRWETTARSWNGHQGPAWRATCIRPSNRLTSGTNGRRARVTALGTFRNGHLLVGGRFTTAGGQPSSGIARYGSAGWATGFQIGGDVESHAFLANGDLVVGGYFSSASGVPVNRIARRTQTGWVPLGDGFDDGVLALCVRQNGELIAAGSFANSGPTPTPRIARWDGSAWQPLASSVNGQIWTLHERPNGDLIAGGNFQSIDGVVIKGIARFDGAQWHDMASVTLNIRVNDLIELPDGRLGAIGNFTLIGGVFAHSIAAWDGAGWNSLGADFGAGTLRAGAFAANGDLVVVGNCQQAGGVSSPHLARLTSTCPASSTLLGAGCPWSGGSNVLSATTPWTGTTWTATGTDLPAVSIVAAVYGLSSTSLPLGSLFPTAGAGCSLFVQADVLDVGIASAAGTFQSHFPLPSAPSLVGAVFHFQMIPIELDPQGAFGAVTATDARSLTVGSF